MSTTTTILPVEYKGYTIKGNTGNGRALVLFPTEAGIQHDYDGNDEGYRYTGNCKWADSVEEAKDIIDELGYASLTARVKRFKESYSVYQASGGTFDWKQFRNDNRFPH